MSNPSLQRYGFGNQDSTVSVLAIKAAEKDVIAYLSQQLELHSYRSNIIDQQVELFPKEVLTLVYKLSSSEWTILCPHYAGLSSGYFGSVNTILLLPGISASLGPAAVCWVTDVGCYHSYSFYVDGKLSECLKFDSEKLKGYEDISISDELLDISETYGEEAEIETYFHYINASKNINRLEKGLLKSGELTCDFMKRHDLYVPDFHLKPNSIKANSIQFDFEDVNEHELTFCNCFYIKPQL